MNCNKFVLLLRNGHMWNKMKPYMMPVAMLTGAVFYKYLAGLGFITPFLISCMLFISYTTISLKDIKINKLHLWLLLIQVVGSVIVYVIFQTYNPVLAQGVMICILAPTATSAIVITAMLKGNTTSLATFTVLSNMAVVVCAPIIFVIIGYNEDISLWQAGFIIFQKVFLILLFPFILSLTVKSTMPFVFNIIRKQQSFSFYIWILALTIVSARTVDFILLQDASNYKVEIGIALFAFIACIVQFMVGRRIGKIYNDTVAAGQALGQKNTILAIWMAQTYLNPVSSIGPGMYIIWQNLVNSYQIWKIRNRN